MIMRSVDFSATKGPFSDSFLYETLFRRVDDLKAKRLLGTKGFQEGYTLWETKLGCRKQPYRILSPCKSTEWESLYQFKAFQRRLAKAFKTE